MQEYYDYTFIFEDMRDKFNSVQMINRSRNEIFNFVFDDSEFLPQNGRLSDILADLTELAVAIYFVDKLALPKKRRSISIEIGLPVRHPEIFNRASEELEKLLFWYTRDKWSFWFKQRNCRDSSKGLHQKLFSVDFVQASEFALWSGGLDSFAGLYTRMLENPQQKFSLVGVGINRIMNKVQRETFRYLYLLNNLADRLSYKNFHIEGDYLNKKFRQNKVHRARGFVFLMLGTVCALANSSHELHVYENGIGALNLALPGGVGRDHSKGVHPRSLFYLSNFISKITRQEFVVKNPFLFSTKAQMCLSIKDCNERLSFETISCDRLHREKPIQCGFCSSCILRRQAFEVIKVEDITSYLIPHGRESKPRYEVFLRFMIKQVEVVKSAIETSRPWDSLATQFSEDLPQTLEVLCIQGLGSRQEIVDNIVNLYRTYVLEWEAVVESVFKKLKDDNENHRNFKEEKWKQMPLTGLIHES